MNRDEYYAALHANRAYVEEHKDELMHWGIKGQKWGIRRYQNPDGTLTEEGKKHYGRLTADYNYTKSDGVTPTFFAKRDSKIANKSAVKEYNKDLKRLSKESEKAQKIMNVGGDATKHLIKANAYADLLDNEKLYRSLGDANKVNKTRGVAGAMLLGVPGSIAAGGISAIANAYSNYHDQYQKLYNKYKDMPLSALEKQFKQNITATEKVKTVYQPENK